MLNILVHFTSIIKGCDNDSQRKKNERLVPMNGNYKNKNGQ